MYLFLEAQTPVIEAIRRQYAPDLSPLLDALRDRYRAKHSASGICICCPRLARPNRSKCELCASKTPTYQALGTQTCSTCGGSGHNKRSCLAEVVAC